MQKTISILLTLCFLLMMSAGCSGSKKAPESVQAPPQTAESINQGVSEAIQEAAETINQGASAPIASAIPAEAYSKYVEVKGKAFDRINAKLEENSALYMSVGMALLPITMVDLSLIPLSVIGLQGEMALGMLGMKNVKIEQNGAVYSVVYQDDEGESVKISCEYDAATDSMKSVTTRNGQEILIFEYVKIGDGYVSQYSLWDAESNDFSWITSFFDESSIAAFGMATTDKKQDSIFKNTSLTSDFVINGSSYFILENDTLTVLEDGEVKTY